jgi:hypothetical protein
MGGKIGKSYTVSVAITGKNTPFLDTIVVKDFKIVGIIAHLNNEADTRRDVVGKKLVRRNSSTFLRLEGVDTCDNKFLNIPLESFATEGKHYPFVEVDISRLLTSNCEVIVADFNETTDENRVVQLTFFTE